jgi:hypothetical protein
METLEERMDLIRRHVGNAVNAVNADGQASAVLKAVVQELNKKSEKARGVVKGGDPRASLYAVIEVEQAADSMKAAAEADSGISEGTKKTIIGAHDAFCLLKNDLLTAK